MSMKTKTELFTGEVSAKMLKRFNVTYVLVGHSERRKYYFESNNKN